MKKGTPDWTVLSTNQSPRQLGQEQAESTPSSAQRGKEAKVVTVPILTRMADR